MMSDNVMGARQGGGLVTKQAGGKRSASLRFALFASRRVNGICPSPKTGHSIKVAWPNG